MTSSCRQGQVAATARTDGGRRRHPVQALRGLPAFGPQREPRDFAWPVPLNYGRSVIVRDLDKAPMNSHSRDEDPLAVVALCSFTAVS